MLRSALQGPINCASTIIREEGLKALWSGNTATVIRQGSNQMSLFWGKAIMDRLMWGKQVCQHASSLFPSFFSCMNVGSTSDQMLLFWGKAIMGRLMWGMQVGGSSRWAALFVSFFHRGQSI